MAPARDPIAEAAVLQLLARQFPSLDAVVGEIARLSAQLTLPTPAIHVLSDVHGEHVKLRHVINNASGTLRPLVERLWGDHLSPAELQEFLSLVFYPAETLERLGPALADPAALRRYCQEALRRLLDLIRVLARRRSRDRVVAVFPAAYRSLLDDLLAEPAAERGPDYLDAIVRTVLQQGRALHLLRLTVRAVRDLAIDELIVAGDCFDRGPRADRVLEYLMHQPNVAFTWGNHDAAWLGACLGQEALIAHVLRISIRYRRLSQLEEGYGITMQPLEHLVREVYADDPAARFVPKGSGLRETVTMARMQKAAAVLQFKLEGQTIERNPVMRAEMDNRRLLHRIDPGRGTVEIDGATYALRDGHFPTLDPAAPYRLTSAEQACMDRLRRSFLGSRELWRHLSFFADHASLYLRRDDHLIFHGCVPVDEHGGFLAFPLDGREYQGRALFEALDRVIARALEQRQAPDTDLLWYLWCGPRSPLFGKDRITTFERDLVEDPRTHTETKNPYFKLIHDAGFCERVLTEFGTDPTRGLIVNGHVPVKIEKGESPVKQSGKAITIDGAFSEAYGDHGYTLVIEADRTFLAMHHHFDSVEAAVEDGVDIIPTITTIREWDVPRRVADSERGAEIRAEVALLERLADAYRSRTLRPGG